MIFFFVLSGFVLAYGLWRGDQSTRFSTFVSRRLARIYLPYAAAALLAVVAMIILRPAPLADTAITFNEMWSEPLTWATVGAHLSLMGTRAANAINIPSWSLVYELRISLLMPVLCVVAMRSSRLLATGALAAFVLGDIALASMGSSLVPYDADGLWQNVIVTLHFTADFVIGVLLAKASLARSSWLFDMSVRGKVVLAVAAAALLLVFRDETASIGSALIMILALNSAGFQKILRVRFLLWVGRLSFSLYLTHMIVLEIAVRALHGLVPLHASIVIGLAAMVPVMILFFTYVEQPAYRLSKHLGRVRLRPFAWMGQRTSAPILSSD